MMPYDRAGPNHSLNEILIRIIYRSPTSLMKFYKVKVNKKNPLYEV